jgi:putative hydrolase of the HAD superfamily
MRLNGVNTVVFDLDGTLCYYSVSIKEAMEQTLRLGGQPSNLVGDLDRAAARYDALWEEEERTHDAGRSLRERIWGRLLGEHGVDEPLLAHTLSDVYTRIRVPSIRLFDGARELLVGLKRRYRLGLLTNGPADMQREKIDALKIGTLFDAVVVSGEIGLYKPDVRVFQYLLEQLRVPPHQALYVGDSYAMDVVGAKEAGMCMAWIRRGQSTNSGDVTPDLELQDVGELREILL